MLCYVLADALLFSGIIAVMACALLLVRYAEFNFEQRSIDAFAAMTHMLAQTFEAALFMDMGMQVAFVVRREEQIDWAFGLLAVPFTLVARAAGTAALTALLNVRRARTGRRIGWREQVVVVMCGLRGGIAFALARSWEPDGGRQAQTLFATCVLIVFTIMAYGLTMRPAIRMLGVRLEAHGRARDVAGQTLMRPAVNAARFADALMGREGHWERALHRVDRALQKAFLNNPLPMDREMVDNVRQIQALYYERHQRELEMRDRARSMVLGRKSSFIFTGKPRTSTIQVQHKDAKDVRGDKEIITTAQVYEEDA